MDNITSDQHPDTAAQPAISFVNSTAVSFESGEMQKLRTGLIKSAFAQLRVSMVATFFLTLALCYLLWDYVDHRITLIWMCLIVATSFWRFYTAGQFRQNPDRHPLSGWERRFLYGVMSNSILFSAAILIFFVPENYYAQSVLLIIFSGLTAGAVNTLSMVPIGVNTLLITTLLPLFFRLIYEHTAHHYTYAVLVMAFLLMQLIVARRQHRDLVNTLKSGILFEKATQQLALNEERFGMIFREAPVGIFFYDTHLRILESNQRFSDILQAPLDYLIGLDMEKLSDTRILPALKIILNKQGGIYEGQYRTTLSGTEIYVVLRTEPVLDANRELIGGIAIVADITERMLAQEKIRRQAYYDSLTNIPNRHALIERVKFCTIRYRRHNRISAVLFLDLDQFKKINDSLGHAVGDELLKETARRLKDAVFEEDFVARLGGDEFVILLPDLSEIPTEASARAEVVAEKIHRALEAPFQIMNHQLNTSTSIGVAITDDENATPENLLKHADTSMYQAKKEGRGKTRFYQKEMDRWVKNRLQLEHDLRLALDQQELELHYQPVLTLGDDRVIGAEALLRWYHPQRGYIPPNEVVSLAEECGLIIELGQWVLEEACRQLKTWRSTQHELMALESVAINVSSLQFKQPDYVEQLLKTMKSYGIKPQQLGLELTESVMIEKTDETIAKMQQLRDHGFAIAIDDFGTGYASLSYLRQLPFSLLKIDRSFIQDVIDDEGDAMLVETIIAIAKKFNLRVIAEGVENCEQYTFLKAAKCEMYQGYLRSPALPADEFVNYFKAAHKVCRDR